MYMYILGLQGNLASNPIRIMRQLMCNGAADEANDKENIMDLKECYESIGADYGDVTKRLMNERLVRKFVLKFLDDKSYENLCTELQAGHGEEAFRAAHTLKGVCQNLGFTSLYEVTHVITEKLRGRQTDGCEELMDRVTEEYEKTVAAIKMLDN